MTINFQFRQHFLLKVLIAGKFTVTFDADFGHCQLDF